MAGRGYHRRAPSFGARPAEETLPAPLLPTLDATFELDPSTIDAFARDGHVAIRGLASPAELAPVRPILLHEAPRRAWDRRPLEQRNTYGRAFLQSFNLWRVHPAIRHFIFAPRFARIAAELLGVAGVRLYHDQALFKEPGGGPTPWHQDQVYWPLATDRTVTLWMPLVDLPPEVGSMRFVSGSHRMGDLGGSAIGNESHAFFEALIAERGLRVESHGALRAGDATFHAGWTVHSAGPNPTNRMRSVMTIIYVADGTRVSKIANAARALDQKAWLGGRKPGERVEGELNPRLWPPG